MDVRCRRRWSTSSPATGAVRRPRGCRLLQHRHDGAPVARRPRRREATLRPGASRGTSRRRTGSTTSSVCAAWRDGSSAATRRAWRSSRPRATGSRSRPETSRSRRGGSPGPGRRVPVGHLYVAALRRADGSSTSLLRAWDSTWTESVLAALDERVAIVSVPNVHWTDGALLDLVPIAYRTHEVGARLVIDASQSLGVLPIDVEHLRPDVVTRWATSGCSGRSASATSTSPKSTAAASRRRRTGSSGRARTTSPGWSTTATTTCRAPDGSTSASGRTSSWCRWPSPGSSRSWPGGFTRIEATLAQTTGALATTLRGLGLDALPDGQRGPHIARRRPCRRLFASGIVPHLARANCFVALRSTTMRIAPHLHTTPADIDRLVYSLQGALR